MAKMIGWIVGISLFVGLTSMLPGLKCADGWASPSIGRQGACSHHGGVDNNGEYIFFILVASIFGGVFVSFLFEDDQPTNNYTTYNDEFYTYKEVVLLIRTAIHEGRKIEFEYKKPKKKCDTRKIKPIEFVKISHHHYSGTTLCIVGYCEKRDAERSFALKRMSNVRIL